LGSGVGQNIRLYGKEFEVISDPFPEAGGIAVRAKAKDSQGIHMLQLPAHVLKERERAIHRLRINFSGSLK
jgi:hypothetical protein